MKQIKTTSKVLFAALIVLFVSSCIHIEPSHYGTVVDAETLKPLSSTDVYESLEYRCILSLSPGGTSYEKLGNYASKSDEKGKYRLPFKVFFIPPFLCSVKKDIGFIKGGYFEYGYGLGTPWSEDLKDPQEIKLFKLTHYLNILHYMNKDKYHYSGDFENVPESYIKAFDSIKTMKVTALDDKGIFVRHKDKRFSRIYNLKSYDHDFKGINYIFDSRDNKWISIDSKGKAAKLEYPNQPAWFFASQEGSTHWTIFADKNSFHYFPFYNPMPPDSHIKRDDIKIIPSKRGDISAIAGYAEKFITIENSGESLCFYGRPGNRGWDDPVFLKEISGLNIPKSNTDNAIRHTKFMHLTSHDADKYLLTKTPAFWHLYKIKLDSFENNIVEIGYFPIEKEITSFIEYGNAFYFAIKNEGIKKYAFINNKLIEDTNSFNLFNSEIYKHIISMSVSTVDNLPVIYAVSGDERVFRFTLDGISDYPIELSQSIN